MGTIISKVEALDRVRWTQPKNGQVMNAKRIMFITDRVAVIELATGAYTVAGIRHSPNGNWAVPGYGRDDFTKSVLNGLVKLGVLTRQQVQKHLVDVETRDRVIERKYALESLKSSCEKLGIPMPAVPKLEDK